MIAYIGYHGTDKEAAQGIVSSQKFIPSSAEDEWLGEGVYFFWDPDDSHWWCTDISGLKSYVVLQARLNAASIIDLVHKRSDQEEFKKLCDRVQHMSAKMPNGNIRKNYMSLALKIMVKEIKPDIIIGGFDQNRKFWFTNYDKRLKFPVIPLQVQLCVLKSKCIENITVYQEVV